MRKPAILGRRWTPVPKNQLPLADWGHELLQGRVRVHRRGGGICVEEQSALDCHLEIGHRWSSVILIVLLFSR